MFVGYSVDHANDVYRILSLNYKWIIQAIDVVWLGKQYIDWRKNNAPLNDNDKDEDIGHSMEDSKV
jgi:hypothetical protein